MAVNVLTKRAVSSDDDVFDQGQLSSSCIPRVMVVNVLTKRAVSSDDDVLDQGQLSSSCIYRASW